MTQPPSTQPGLDGDLQMADESLALASQSGGQDRVVLHRGNQDIELTDKLLRDTQWGHAMLALQNSCLPFRSAFPTGECGDDRDCPKLGQVCLEFGRKLSGRSDAPHALRSTARSRGAGTTAVIG